MTMDDLIVTLTGMDFKVRSTKEMGSDKRQDLCLLFEKVTKSDEASQYFQVFMNREDMYDILCDLLKLEADKKTPMLNIPMYENGIDFSDEADEEKISHAREDGLLTVSDEMGEKLRQAVK